MSANGGKWGKVWEFWMLNGIIGNLGAEKVKKHGFDWQQS